MSDIREGHALVYGDNINTDIISPPQYMELSVEEAAPYAMSGVDPEFSQKVKPGDILVGGKNFGSGSSRELAPLSLRYLGIGAIVAEFFARIFYRNAINLGLPVVECREISKAHDGDLLSINFVEGIIHNKTRNETYECSTLPPHILALIREGGLIANLKKQMENSHPTT